MSENLPIPATNELGLSEEDLDAVSGGGPGDIVGEEGTTVITSTTIIVDPR
ncbi:MAG TPA: hypothetical protein VLK84_28735 [Longimicrobium sp.]|nr:hypothetical protein [Longimicrobium sp.]